MENVDIRCEFYSCHKLSSAIHYASCCVACCPNISYLSQFYLPKVSLKLYLLWIISYAAVLWRNCSGTLNIQLLMIWYAHIIQLHSYYFAALLFWFSIRVLSYASHLQLIVALDELSVNNVQLLGRCLRCLGSKFSIFVSGAFELWRCWTESSNDECDSLVAQLLVGICNV